MYGFGPPLVICPYFFESFDGDDPFSDFMAALTVGRRVIRYDHRGVGLSQREGAEISIRALDRDLGAVVRAAGLERFDLIGWIVGGLAAMSYAALHPVQVDHLVLYTSFVTGTEVMPRAALNGLAALSRTNWQMASQTLVDMSGRATDPDLNLRQAEILRSGSPERRSLRF